MAIQTYDPGIDYASINGSGLNGADKDAPGFDMTAC